MALQAKTREKLRDRVVVFMGQHRIGRKNAEERNLYASVSKLAAEKLGLTAIDPVKVSKKDITYIVQGGKARTVRVRLTKAAASGAGTKGGSVTIRVPSYAGTVIVADFLNKNAKNKVTSFQMKSRGRSYSLAMFDGHGASTPAA